MGFLPVGFSPAGSLPEGSIPVGLSQWDSSIWVHPCRISPCRIHPCGIPPYGIHPCGVPPSLLCPTPAHNTPENKGRGDLGSVPVTPGQGTCPPQSRSDQLSPCPSRALEFRDALGSGGHGEPALLTQMCSPRQIKDDLVISTPRNNQHLAGRSSSLLPTCSSFQI